MGASLGQKHFPTISSLPTPVQGQKHSAKVIQSRHEQWNELNTLSPALGTAAADGHRALLGVLGRCVKHSHVLSCMGTHAVRLGGGTERTGTTPPGSNEDGWLLGRCVGRGGHPGGAESWEQSHEATTLCRPRPAEGTCIHYSGCQQDLQPVCPTGQHLPGTDTSTEWCKTPNAAPPLSELSRAPGLCPHACPPPSAQ